MKESIAQSTIKGMFALAASAALLSGCVTSGNSSTASTDMGECHGVNSCKGQGACGGKGHSCAGKNTCKGQGWLKMNESTCKEKGGTFKAG